MCETACKSLTIPLRRGLKNGQLGLALWLALCPAAFPNDAGFPGPTWAEIRLEASQGLAKASTEVSLRSIPDARLMEGHEGKPIKPGNGSVVLATAQVRARIPFKRKHWSGRVWFDDASGAALQRVRLKPGKDASRKSYRFGQEGVDRVVARPRNRGEADRDADAWTNTRHRYFPYPSTRPGCGVVSDPMLLLISAAGLSSDGNTHRTVCVFNKKTLYHVDLRAEGTEELRASYALTTKDGQTSAKGPVAATRVRLSARLVDPASPDREDFEFLGLEGEIRIWIDGATDLPLAIEGELSGVGQVRFKLTAAAGPSG